MQLAFSGQRVDVLHRQVDGGDDRRKLTRSGHLILDLLAVAIWMEQDAREIRAAFCPN